MNKAKKILKSIFSSGLSKEDKIAAREMSGMKLFSRNTMKAAFIREGYSEQEAQELAEKYVWSID